MKTFPELKSCDFAVKGVGLERSAADVVLSNLGWVAVTARVGSLVTVQAHSPNGIGLDIREPLCPTCVTKRGEMAEGVGLGRFGGPSLSSGRGGGEIGGS